MNRVISKLSYLILIAVILGLLVLRFFGLTLAPNGLHWDEVAYAYNAYSLLQTGKDEWGASWPLYLKSFGEYKPALLSYITMGSFILLGVNDDSVRITITVVGIISLLASYFFFVALINKKVALCVLLFLCLSPWHFHYSRMLTDPLFSFCFGMLGFAFIFQKNIVPQLVGVIFFAISMYTYHSEKLIIPLLVFCAALLFKHSLKRSVLITSMVCAVSAILIGSTFFTATGQRAKDVFVLSKPEISNQVNEIMFRSAVTNIPNLRLLNNKVISSVFTISNNYLVHFQPDFLFFKNNLGPRHAFSHYGNLLLATLPFIILGIVYCIRNYKDKINLFFLIWLFITPIPAAFTDDVPHSGRTLMMLVPFAYFFSSGLLSLFKHIHLKFGRFLLISSVGLMVLANFCLYLRDYFLFFPEESIVFFQGYMKPLSQRLYAQKDNYDGQFIDGSTQNSYIFYAWYNKIEPAVVQKFHSYKSDSEISVIDNVRLTPISELEYYCLLTQENLFIISQKDFIESKESQARSSFHLMNRYKIGDELYQAIDTNRLEATLSALAKKRCEKLNAQ